ncbi:MAG: aldehyde dehydrogenase family protein [Oceanospirillales bacterium TMED33]|nr:aldehyde dehydrogenase [Gammaproteobacteria bacterium]RPG22348.1 MAG: aldehyde dehydrogenase family protein [Oceanospirillales bacterium TMED33]
MDRLNVTNPFDGEIIGEIVLSSERDVETALATAAKTYEANRKGLPKHERIAILKKAAEIMVGRSDELAMLIAAEGGKPLIDARVEVARAIDGVETCAAEITHNAGVEIPMDLTPAGNNKLAFTTREPIGTVVAISAFNHPLNLIVHRVAPAVAAGNPVIVKPADDTPLSCKLFVDILHQAGLPPAWARCICCEVSLAQKLVTDERVAFFSFIGSAAVGWKLRSLLAPGTRVALEHGGVAPVIVGPSADRDQLVPSLVKGGFYHSGQVCVSVQRVFSYGSSARTLAEAIADHASNLVVGNATAAETQCGPLIRNREVDRVEAWVEEAVSAGAEVMCGGKRMSDSCYAPTVLLNPPENCRVSREEIFGPVISVYEKQDMDDSIAQANSLPYAFQASVFSNDYTEIMKAVNGLDGSAIMVNEHSAFRVDWMPFAGRKRSGLGVGGIAHTLEDMSQSKMAILSFG